jgi:uncharacterized membrane protein YqhA
MSRSEKVSLLDPVGTSNNYSSLEITTDSDPRSPIHHHPQVQTQLLDGTHGLTHADALTFFTNVDDDDDLITVSVKSAHTAFAICLRGWVATGYILLLLHLFIETDLHKSVDSDYKKHRLSHTGTLTCAVLIFAPMTGSTVAAMYVLVRQLRKVYTSGFSLISRERQLFLLTDSRQQQRQQQETQSRTAGRSTDASLESVTQGQSYTNIIAEKYILFESFPLMRSYFFVSGVILVSLCLCVWSQLLLFGHTLNPHFISVWGALGPANVVVVCLLFYICVCTKVPLVYVLLLIVCVSDGVLFVDNLGSNNPREWELVITPALFVQACVCLHLVCILWQTLYKRVFILEKNQARATWMMLLAFVLMIIAEGIVLSCPPPVLYTKSTDTNLPSYAPTTLAITPSYIDRDLDLVIRFTHSVHQSGVRDLNGSTSLGYIPQMIISMETVWDTYEYYYRSLIVHFHKRPTRQEAAGRMGASDSLETSYLAGRTVRFPSIVSLLLWVIAITLISEAVLIILRLELQQLALTRGFLDPTPLSLTSQGWVEDNRADALQLDNDPDEPCGVSFGSFGDCICCTGGPRTWIRRIFSCCEFDRQNPEWRYFRRGTDKIRSPLIGLITVAGLTLDDIESIDRRAHNAQWRIQSHSDPASNIAWPGSQTSGCPSGVSVLGGSMNV